MKPPDWAAFFLASLRTFDGKTLMVRMAKVWTDWVWPSEKCMYFSVLRRESRLGWANYGSTYTRLPPQGSAKRAEKPDGPSRKRIKKP